ncbi:FAD dependent oxidoreductase [Acaromyces ingoldii]|uniref:FAD dependent oxidoreductase n=1 Tax=Acaromyces ingoldii TaxID=215250 RepID=A0A316YQ77_9BASI|nr:FAD dependent oxidoreductase [Acaromyces ingoldii]PWN90193.1 FAD dependent oxidoreductase [Acaromyces ingoldii]
MPPISKSSSIIVVGGAGTFGSSTALHLARRGYTNVTAIDKFPPPSQVSAGNDLNKIIRTEYSEKIYSDLALEAVESWKADPVFSPHFHQTGWIVACSDRNSRTARELIFDPYEHMQTNEKLAPHLSLLADSDAIFQQAPQLKKLGGKLEDWFGLWNGVNGWAMAKDAVEAAAKEAQRLGVRYVCGKEGAVVEVKLGPDGAATLVTADGRLWTADHIILCTGAWSPGLVDLQGQCFSKCWTVGHLQLTPEEAHELKGLPVIDHSDHGFFFEPSLDTHQIKICNAMPGYQNAVGDKDGLSLPSETKFALPDEAIKALSSFIEEVLPRFKDRPVVDPMICWCADHNDGNWLIDFHPQAHANSLLLATGDSGMAFKFLPTIGKYIVDRLEGQAKEIWRWRPEATPKADSSRPEGRVKDLKELDGWPERQKL